MLDEDKLWTCFECMKDFSSSEDLQIHLSQHDQESEDESKSKSESKRKGNGIGKKASKKQVKVLLPQGINCDSCSVTVESQSELVRHKRNVHSVDPKGKWNRCPNCQLWFDSVYRVHLFSHHPDKSQQNLTVEEAVAQASHNESVSQIEMKFQCPECRSQFDTWLDLVDHVSVHGVSDISDESEDEEKKQKCHVCYKVFANEERLKVCYFDN